MAGVVLLLVRGPRRPALWPAVVGGGGAALMLLAALGGADYLNNRNTIPVLAIVLALPALGFAIGRLGAALGVVACLVLGAASIGALIDPAHAREDWRSTAKALRGTQAVIVAPPFEAIPLRWYAPDLNQVPATSATTLAVVVTDPDREPLAPGALATPPAPGFTPAGTTQEDRILIARYRAPAPQPVQGADAWGRSHLGAVRGGAGAVLLGR